MMGKHLNIEVGVLLLSIMMMECLQGSPMFPPGGMDVNITNYCASPMTLPPVDRCPSCSSRCGKTSDKTYQCSCDSKCLIYGDCCADYKATCSAQQSDPPTKGRNMKTMCVNYSEGNSSSGTSAVIGQCLNGTLCKLSSYDTNQGIPVLDILTGLHYINAQCAICNNVQKARPWKVNISCDSSMEKEWNSTEVDLNQLLARKICKIDLNGPPGKYGIRFCHESVVEKCGQGCDNELLVEMCERSAIQSYTSSWFTLYRNFYCLQCSPEYGRMGGMVFECGDNYLLEEAQPGIKGNFNFQSGITVIFDFNPTNGLEVGSEDNKEEVCPIGSAWIRQEGICRDVTCQPGFRLRGNECYPSHLNTSLKAMVVLQNERDTNKMIDYLSETHDWEKTIRDDMTRIFDNYYVEDGVLKINSSTEKVEDNTVNVTFQIFIGLYRNATFNETDFNEFMSKAKKTIKGRAFEVLQQLEIVLSTVKIIFDDQALTFPRPTSGCRWHVYNSSEFYLNNSYLLLPSTGVSYDHSRYTLEGNVAFVCVRISTWDVKYPSSDAFNIIIAICTILSILCLSIRIILQFFFSYFRSFAGRLQFNLCIALCLAYLFLLIGGILVESEPKTPCMIIGTVTYFFFISAFGWMTCIALNTWIVFRPSSSFIKADDRGQSITPYVLIGWALPIVLSVVVLSLDFSGIDPKFKPSFGHKACWFNQRYAMLIYFGLPVAICISINSVLFIITVCVLRKTFKDSVQTSNNYVSEIHHIGIYVRLFILMGLSWALGFVAAFTGELAIWIIYAVLNASQGVLIFISFVCRKPIIKMICASWAKTEYSTDSRSQGTKSTSASQHEGVHLSLTKQGKINSS